MTKIQRNHRNTMPGKVSNVTTARPISYQKQKSTNEMQQQTSNAKESDITQNSRRSLKNSWIDWGDSKGLPQL